MGVTTKPSQTHKPLLFYKILHGIASNYLSDVGPPLVQETTTYNLKNSDFTANYPARTTLFLHPFFPSTIRALNDLSTNVKTARSVASFKQGIKLNIKEPPKYYNVGTPKLQVLHARLRLECSSLNADLYRKHIVNSIGVTPITQYTHACNKNCNTPGNSPDVIKVIFHTLRNCS